MQRITDNPHISPVRVAIIDDDIASVKLLANALKEYGPLIELCGTAMDVSTGRELIAEEIPDLVFLDIEFPEEGESGLDLLDIPSWLDIDIIFYTSYQKYLLQALRVRAFDFLLKPFDDEELSIIMHRYFMKCDTRNERPSTDKALHSVTDATKLLSITTVTNDKVIIKPDDIVFFKYASDRKVWEVVLSNLQRHILKRNTKAEDILNYGSNLVRTHKSYVVNVAYISMITAQYCSLVPPYDRITDIRISKAFRRQVLDHFYEI